MRAGISIAIAFAVAACAPTTPPPQGRSELPELPSHCDVRAEGPRTFDDVSIAEARAATRAFRAAFFEHVVPSSRDELLRGTAPCMRGDQSYSVQRYTSSLDDWVRPALEHALYRGPSSPLPDCLFLVYFEGGTTSLPPVEPGTFTPGGLVGCDGRVFSIFLVPEG